jgi:glycosyltransferase involved in cell wall biosynthesis
MNQEIIFSVIVPTKGNRPQALTKALSSVDVSRQHLISQFGPVPSYVVEVLVGFDGAEIQKVIDLPYITWYKFPYEGCFGNAIRNGLLKVAKGNYVLFLDDDNALTPKALSAFYPHLSRAEIIIGRIDTSQSFAEKFLPQPNKDGNVVVQGNIDPLCLCCSRELVSVRCGGWRSQGGYESDYLNIRYYCRRAREIKVIDDIVGIYDAGRGLDPGAENRRQLRITQASKGQLPRARPKTTS